MEKYTVRIKQIDWLDKDCSEAEILFEINGRQLKAFCHPCDLGQGELVEVGFSFIEEDIAESSFWEGNKDHKREIMASENSWGYYCYGQIKSIHPVKIDCGDITFSFGDWINDKNAIGSFVYFVISRLDISRI